VLYIVLSIAVLALITVALYGFLKSRELASQLAQATAAWQKQEEAYLAELNALDKLRPIPNVIEKARKAREEAEASLAQAYVRAEEIVRTAVEEARQRKERLVAKTDKALEASKEELRVAKWQAENVLDEARKEAKAITSRARKEAKEKVGAVDEALDRATAYAFEIRQKAEKSAREIAGEAVAAKGKLADYQAVVEALQNRIEKYEGVYMVPSAHILDELAEEFGFSKAGEKLKLARERTRIMRDNGTAAITEYPEGWKRDHALKFVLSTFDGKVDSILSRVKPGNQGRVTQEVKDAYALVNKDGAVYKNARIQQEYLDSRLEEIKWAVAVQKLKEKTREEQRAIREQIREEERAKKEIEKAIKQAAREEELVNKAIARLRK
jgi:vacuolar-type H+-ATPase subunit H